MLLPAIVSLYSSARLIQPAPGLKQRLSVSLLSKGKRTERGREQAVQRNGCHFSAQMSSQGGCWAPTRGNPASFPPGVGCPLSTSTICYVEHREFAHMLGKSQGFLLLVLFVSICSIKSGRIFYLQFWKGGLVHIGLFICCRYFISSIYFMIFPISVTSIPPALLQLFPALVWIRRSGKVCNIFFYQDSIWVKRSHHLKLQH